MSLADISYIDKALELEAGPDLDAAIQKFVAGNTVKPSDDGRNWVTEVDGKWEPVPHYTTNPRDSGLDLIFARIPNAEWAERYLFELKVGNTTYTGESGRSMLAAKAHAALKWRKPLLGTGRAR